MSSLGYFMAWINKLNEILLAFYVSNCWHILNWICKEKNEENAWDILIILAVASARFYRPSLFLVYAALEVFAVSFFFKYRWWPNLRKNQTTMNFCCTSHLFLCFLCFSLFPLCFFIFFACDSWMLCCALGGIVRWGAGVHYWPRHGPRADRRLDQFFD